MQVMLRGRWWKIVREKMSDRWGDCKYSKRRIRIDSRASGFQFMDTAIHEMLHALLPDYCEESVAEMATELASALDALGIQHR